MARTVLLGALAMNMAQRGALFLVGFLLAACGGNVSDGPGAGNDTGSQTDSGVDSPPFAGGWASYTMRITASTRTWSSGGPSPEPGDPTSGWSGRLDLDPGGRGAPAHAVMLPTFDDGTTLEAPSGNTITFTAKDALLRISGYGGFQNVSDSYDTFTLQVSSDGTPYAGTLSGRTMATSGDVAWDGKVTATVAFEQDGVGPTWRWSGETSFASVTLPWDLRTIEASEPYEETLTIDRLVASTFSDGTIDAKAIDAQAHGTTLQRGMRFSLLDWNLSDTLSANEALVHDFAKNETMRTKPLAKIPGVAVALRPTPSWAPDDGGPRETTWGSANVVEADCTSCPAEMVLGPVHAGGCAPGSEAGVAVRLPASGPYYVRLRLHVTPPPYPMDSPPGVSGFVHVQLVNPGKKPIDVDLSAIKWPATPAADGSYDSGFVDVLANPGGEFPETGIAVSGGGLGTFNPCGLGGPMMPASWSGTVTVEHIVQIPPP